MAWQDHNDLLDVRYKLNPDRTEQKEKPMTKHERNPGETELTIDAWVVATFGTKGTDRSVVNRANKEMAELVEKAGDYGKVEGVTLDAVLEEAADVIITLNRLFTRNGRSAWAEVEKKMAINRKRKWDVVNGHGQHVKELVVTKEMVAAVKAATCSSCGAKPYEDCQRHPQRDCFREFNGGSRKAV